MISRGIKVVKFGGTSLGSVEAIKRTISIIQRPNTDARIVAVVVSAISGVTDELIKIATLASKKDLSYAKLLVNLEKRHLYILEILVSVQNRAKSRAEIERMFGYLRDAMQGIRLMRDLSPQTLDYVMSYGERLSAHILTEAMKDLGISVEYLNARKIIRTDNNFGAAKVDFKYTNQAIRKYFRTHKNLQIITGFIGATPEKKTTTLERGGSDYSVAIIGAALGARVIEIWTDVSGIYTADPHLVKKAVVVPELSFEEAGELAYFGAKILHPKTILPAMREKIPVRVLNTFMPDDKGTTIVAGFAERRVKSHTIEALTFKSPIIVIHLQSPEFFDESGLMAGIFEVFDNYRMSVDIVATSVAGVTLTVNDDKHLNEVVHKLKKFGNVSIEREKAIVCAVGGSVNLAGVSGRMFTALGSNGIQVELISQAAGGVSITFVVKESDAKKALEVLHKEYIER